MRKGFTLAEVLITLTIIGVIAALTIPNLVQKHQEHALIAKLKKSHSVLSNVITQAVRENGTPDNWDITPQDSFTGSQKLFNYISPYLKIQKLCGNSSGCFAKTYKTLNGNSIWTNIDTDTKIFKGILADGTSFYIWRTKKDCEGDNVCAILNIDLNNFKGPNRLGMDFFHFGIKANGLMYIGNDSSRCSYTNKTNNQNGAYCTYWALYKGNMDYKYRDVSAEW